MIQAKYDNSTYWVDIHQNFSGSLRAVGWPTLSEEFNRLKYLSESETFQHALGCALNQLKEAETLEVGVGIGFFTAVQAEFCENRGTKAAVTAMDISPSALEIVKEKHPDALTILADLKTVDTDLFANRYDLVTAIMVLLHLTDIQDYIHALTFCAHSVKRGGYLLIYEPLISKEYSPFNAIEYSGFTGNSIPRSSALVDNVVANAGLVKCAAFPGASWLLNSPIQAHSKFTFKIKRAIWVMLVKFVFRSDRLTKMFSKLLLALDKIIKKENPDSGTFVLYKKQAQSSA